MAYRLAIFDFDGTLADTMPWFVGVLNEVSDRFGIRRIDQQEYDALREMSPVQIMKYPRRRAAACRRWRPTCASA